MWLIHHVSENLIFNQGCLQKYNGNENTHVNNNKLLNRVSGVGNGITYGHTIWANLKMKVLVNKFYLFILLQNHTQCHIRNMVYNIDIQ